MPTRIMATPGTRRLHARGGESSFRGDVRDEPQRTGYEEDMNPDMIGGIHVNRDRWASRNVELASALKPS